MNRRVKFAGLFVAVAGAALVSGQSPQAPTPATPTFKTEIEYVEVDALVTDQQGQFVRDLSKDDFQVFENGKQQPITAFSLVDIPIERYDRPLFSPQPIEPDVQSNERPFDGRVYVMILDDLHTAALRSHRVRAAAHQFIERNLGANDLMAVIFTGGRSQDGQEFTSNKRLLLAAVDKFTGQKLASATLGRNEEYRRQVESGASGYIRDPEEMQRVYNTRALLTSVQKVAEWFGGVRGRRKTMLLISEGIDYDITDIIRQPDAPPSSATGIQFDIQNAINATVRANVSIYSIDPRGLADAGDGSIQVSSFADFDDPSMNIGQRSLNSELRLSQDSLRQLADETGGFAAINRNNLTTTFDRIVRDNSAYYVLAYYPPAAKRDGKFHRIEVKVNRPGLAVRSRRGYASPRGNPAPQNTKTGGMSPEVYETVNSPLQVSGLRMRAFAAPFKGTAPNGSVLMGVELVGRDLSLDPSSKVDVSYVAVDSKGKVFGPRNDVLTMNLRPDSRTRAERTGFRLISRMELPPGRYQLRIAARDSVKTNVGSLIYDLEVPDFYKEPFTVSGLVLTSLGSAGMVNAKIDEQLRELLPTPPVSTRTFARNDELAVFAEVYDNSGDSPHKVDIVTTVLTDEGRVLFKTEETRDSSELGGARGGYGYTARIPLSEIAPGPYVLNVEARSRLGQATIATRQVQFRVLAEDPAPQP